MHGVPLALLPLLLVPGKDTRDVVELTSGKKLRGRVVLEQDKRIVLQVGSVEREIARRKIASFSNVFRSQWEVLKRFRDLRRPDARKLLELADYCKEQQLPHTERLFCWRVLLEDEDHPVANQRLGHKQRRGKWLIPGRGGALPMERAEKVRSVWAKAWELRSEHYEVRSSSDLRATINTLLDLEFFYHYALSIFQKELELREVVKPMKVALYRDQDQFPDIPRASAYFKPGENILYTWMSERRRRPVGLFHEATHSLLHNTIVDTSRSRGELPGWLHEGPAVYMQGVVSGGPPGRPDYHEGRRLRRHFKTLAEARRPYKVHRVLNFRISDYHASTKQGLKYAQGYVLFHYMLHGEGERYREAFFDYLREAVLGKGQASTFRKIFRSSLAKIERGHVRYAAAPR